MNFRFETTELMEPVVATHPQASIKKLGIRGRGSKKVANAARV